MPPPVTFWLPSIMDAMAEAAVKAALKAIGVEIRKALKPEQGTPKLERRRRGRLLPGRPLPRHRMPAPC